MSSRREEERNEKIIRGLMKLPPNRRCINCNSLGPQYVCTNFWTFVCTACSGIHREFTHRVKSVSMSKFTSQEVEALQKGGNQRAREIYLKDWDSQRLRLPDNSNADKIREFIKNVYVDKKFSGGKLTDRPPRDAQKLGSQEDETRRASSYHSYSQSPPYDFQYEERRYGKHAPVLSRKPGSDRGLYDGRLSSFLSPSRLSDRMYEDKFAIDRSNSRVSDYSMSSGGDPFRSDVQSPNFQKEVGSPSSETSRDFSSEDLVNYAGNTYPDSHARRQGGRMLPPQRTSSSGSFGSFDDNSLPFTSINSVGLVDIASEPGHTLNVHSNNQPNLPSLPQSSIPGNSDGLDLFSPPFALQNVTSTTSATNTSRLPEFSSNPSLDLFQPPVSTVPTFSSHKVPQTTPSSSLELSSGMPQQLPAATPSETSLNVHVPQNEGWATFDMPQHSAPVGIENSDPSKISSNNNSLDNFHPLLSLDQWPPSQDTSSHGPSSSTQSAWNKALQNAEAIPNTLSTQSWNTFQNSTGQLPSSSTQIAWNECPQHADAIPDVLSTQSWNAFEKSTGQLPSSSMQTVWNEASLNAAASPNTLSTQSWNAFEDSPGQLPFQSVHTSSEQVQHQPSTSDQYLSLRVLEEFNKDGSQSVSVDSAPPLPSSLSHISMRDISTLPVMVGVGSYGMDHKSTNPFDLPYDPEIEGSDMSQFWDTSSLQTALPSSQMPTSFPGGANQPWFPQDPRAPYIPAGSEGALGFMSGQGSSTQISTVPSQGPVASVGGNPFA